MTKGAMVSHLVAFYLGIYLLLRQSITAQLVGAALVLGVYVFSIRALFRLVKKNRQVHDDPK